MKALDYKDLGRRIRLARHTKGLTQTQLAEKMGICASYLGHIERATRITSLETLVCLCNILQVSPDDLLQASLDLHTPIRLENMTPENCQQLSQFLSMAQTALENWRDETKA